MSNFIAALSVLTGAASALAGLWFILARRAKARHWLCVGLGVLGVTLLAVAGATPKDLAPDGTEAGGAFAAGVGGLACLQLATLAFLGGVMRDWLASRSTGAPDRS